jgi:FkbM family methyltransferase
MFLERIFDKFLNRGDTFVDIGANCGYWSAYALSCVGPSGAVHAFEPVPQYFRFLERLAKLNPNYFLSANNLACGARRERLQMSIVLPENDNFDNFDTNIGSSSLFAGFLAHAERLTKVQDVEVIPFDEYLAEHSIDVNRVGLIKVDVEGFEAAVFEGMSQLLNNTGRKVPILCELLTDRERLNPLDGGAIIRRLEQLGYRCLNATDLRPIDPHSLGFEENVLFL